MYVNVGARAALMKDERLRFLTEEWPRVHATIARLGLVVEDLLRVPPAASETVAGPPRPADESTTD
jgi:GntR family transcriptional regulator